MHFVFSRERESNVSSVKAIDIWVETGMRDYNFPLLSL